MPVVLPPGPPVLVDYQMLYGGLRIGRGTKYRLNSIDGIRSLPQLRTSDYARLHHHGVFSGIDVLEGRHVTVTLSVVGSSITDLDNLLTALDAATVPLLQGSSPLIYKLPNQPQRQVLARVRKRDMPIDPTYNLGWAKVTIAFFCSDPRLYSDAVTATTIGIGGAVVITNNGNFESRPVVIATPATTNIGIANDTDGSAFVLLDNATYGAIPNPVIIDMLNRTVTDANNVNRFDLVASTSTWPALLPGPNSFRVSGGSCAFYTRDASI